MKYR
jgi:hypothetical protein